MCFRGLRGISVSPCLHAMLNRLTAAASGRDCRGKNARRVYNVTVSPCGNEDMYFHERAITRSHVQTVDSGTTKLERMQIALRKHAGPACHSKADITTQLSPCPLITDWRSQESSEQHGRAGCNWPICHHPLRSTTLPCAAPSCKTDLGWLQYAGPAARSSRKRRVKQKCLPGKPKTGHNGRVVCGQLTSSRIWGVPIEAHGIAPTQARRANA